MNPRQNKKLNSRVEHLGPLFDSGALVLPPVSISRQLESHLQKLRWFGQSLDMNQLGSAKRIPISTFDFEIAAENLKQTEFGTRKYAIAFFNGDDPPIGGRLDTIMRNIDTIFWKAPGTRFVFGADREAVEWMPALDHFVQYDGGDFLIVSQ